jgi:hypothetical protein
MDIETVLAASEDALRQPGRVDLGSLGFWRTVAVLKRDPQLALRYGERVERIDDEAFLRWARFVLPLWLGVTGMLVASIAGLFVVSLGYFTAAPWNGIWILVGTGILLGSTHTLAHVAVGGAVGIRFTHWFIADRPQPGVKIGYASYLATPPRARAWMHASGAIMTKLVPLLNLGAAWGAGAPGWTVWLLIILELVMIATDVLFSTKNSDWKKFKREMRYVS